MSQTEITVEVLNPLNEIFEILEREKFELIDTFSIDDCYYSKYDLETLNNFSYEDLIKNSFILRKIKNKNKEFIKICHKSKKLDKNENVISETKKQINISNFNTAKEIFSLSNLCCWCTIFNNSYVFKKDDILFAIQQIDNNKIFLEFEENASMLSLNNEEKFELLKNTILSIPLKFGNDFSCKKVFLKFKNLI